MRDHVIVCGLGNVGWRIVQLLHRLGERAAVITLAPREEWAREAQGLGALLLIGDARDQQLLIEAGLLEARALLVVTDVDVVNIEIVLDARKLRADIPIVVRLFDQALARQLEKTSDVRRALSTSVLSAPVFAAAALGKQVIGTFSLDEHPYVIGRIEVTEGLLREVPTIGDLAERRGVAVINLHRGGDEVKELSSEVTLCAGDRLAVVAAQHAWEQVVGGEVTPPPSRLPEMLQPQHLREVAGHAWRQSPLLLRLALLVFVTINLLAVEIFHRGLALSYVDALYLVVSTVTTVGYGDVTPRHDNEGLELFGCLLMLLGTALMAVLYSIITDFVVATRFEQLVTGRRRVPRKDHVVVVGAGTIGYRVIKELHRARIPLVVIDARPDGRFVQDVRAIAPVVAGDARNQEALERVRAQHCRALIACTSDDAVNLAVGLSIEAQNPEVRTVVRLFDGDFASKVEASLAVDVALSPPKIATPCFVAAALYANVLDAFVQDQRLYVLMRRAVDDEWVGKTPAQLYEASGVQVLLRGPAGSPPQPGSASLATQQPRVCVPAGTRLLERGEMVLAVVQRELR